MPGTQPQPSPTAGPATVEAVRLVIWDLDDTFWKGTLTEGGIDEARHAADTVIALARRGIMSSICSRNDFASARTVLERLMVWDYFIFPSIDWTPKGPRIAALIEAVQLRPSTVLFIDDNPMNREEAKYLVPELQVADETMIPDLLTDARCKGKDDTELTRLAAYKVLEEKHEAKLLAGGDVYEFLRDSKITVEIVYDVEAHIDRAIELVNRTNQLNFTKSRLPEDPQAARAALRQQIGMFNVQAGLVRVRDKFGDYGFVGFYVMRRGAGYHELLHYCFSCRTLGMYAELWLWRELGQPNVSVSGEVLTDLHDASIPADWIAYYSEDSEAGTLTPRWNKILIVGGCDMLAASHYLQPHSRAVVTHFNAVRHGMEMRVDHSAVLALSGRTLIKDEARFFATAGFAPEDFLPLHAAQDADLVLISFWADAAYRLFEHKETGLALPFSPAALGHGDVLALDETFVRAKGASPEAMVIYHNLRATARHAGVIDQDAFMRNTHRVLSLLSRRARVGVLLLSEKSCGVFPGMLGRHQLLNRLVQEVAETLPNVTSIRIDDHIAGAHEITGPSHFHRAVYQRVAAAVLDKFPGVDSAPAAPESAAPVLAPLPDPSPEALVADDAEAAARLQQTGAEDFRSSLAIADILHAHGHLVPAVAMYDRAYHQHPKTQVYPLAQYLLYSRLLCQVKDRQAISDRDMQTLRSLNTQYYKLICGTQMLANRADSRAALDVMENSYEEHHTGHESDATYLKGALQVFSAYSPRHRSQRRGVRVANDVIPRNLCLFWNGRPNDAVQRNFDYHRALNHFNIRTFTRREAEIWLYETFGVEARSLFLAANHPAEATDILRAHVLYKYGGYWLHERMKIRSVERFEEALPKNVEHVFFADRDGIVRNDFFGAIRGSEILADCLLSINRNCYTRPDLPIAAKTGAGVLARALNRAYHSALTGAGPIPSVRVLGQETCDEVIEPRPPG